jgi:poly(3-hydroxybutyrate) depolymerase
LTGRLPGPADARTVLPHGYTRLFRVDPVDGSGQFCRAYLPPDYDPKKAWPMVVMLHGYKPRIPEYVD